MRTLVATCIALSCIALSCLAATGVAAQDRPTLALSELRSTPVRQALRRALADRVDVVDVEGATDDPAERAARVAEAGADGLLVPVVAGSRRRPELSLTLYDAAGTELARRTVDLPRGREQRAIADALDVLLAELPARRPAAVVDEPIQRPAPIAELPTPPRPSPAPSRETNYRPFLRLHTGLSMRNRSLELQTDRAQRHSVPLYPELLVEGELRPLGRSDPLLYGLRIRARFAYALYFESATRTAQVVGGGAFSFDGDLGWLAPLGDMVELGPVFGGGYSAYDLDENPIVPSVGYGHVDARAAVRIRALDEQLVLRAEAGYRFAAASGALTARHGSLEGHGVVVSAGVAGTVLLDTNLGLDWGVDLDWQQSWLGAGGGEPTGARAESGVESFVRGRFTVGVSLQ